MDDLWLFSSFMFKMYYGRAFVIFMRNSNFQKNKFKRMLVSRLEFGICFLEFTL